MNFVFGEAYGCPEGYTPLMCAAHRSRLECCKALLRSGADPNYINAAGDLVLFWGIDGGIEIIKLLHEVRRAGEGGTARTGHQRAAYPLAPPPSPQYGVDLDARTPKDWTPLSYAQAKGKYGLSHEKGIYPEDVLRVRSLPSSALLRSTQLRSMRLLSLTYSLFCAQYYGAAKVGTGPERSGARSPRQSYNPEDKNFGRDRGSYQEEMEHP